MSAEQLSINVKKCLYEQVIVPTTLEEETFGMRIAEGIKVNVLEIK